MWLDWMQIAFEQLTKDLPQRDSPQIEHMIDDILY